MTIERLKRIHNYCQYRRLKCLMDNHHRTPIFQRWHRLVRVINVMLYEGVE